jgi:glycosyltransferase involved in cell wall biosynthesis
MKSIAFAWPGLPDYAARCIREVADREETRVTVVATRPNVPIEGMEKSLGQPVIWLDDIKAPSSWSLLGAEVPDVMFCGGYSTPAFTSLARQVRDQDGRAILMSDNNWQGRLKQYTIGPIRHRLRFRSRFDGIFVPGASGMRLARSWGYQPKQIATKLYGADPKLFCGGEPLAERPKAFLYVGQFVDRKNVLRLTEAFVSFAERNSDWELQLCGSGPLVDLIPTHPQISVLGFVQPPQLAGLLRQVRCLVLPSYEEHWGVVVHEAALSGCALALSRAVAAADDLAQPENSVLFQPHDTSAIEKALDTVAAWNGESWSQAEGTSRRLAQGFGPAPFADSVSRLVCALSGVQA